MRRTQFQNLLQEAGRLVGRAEFVVLESQSVHAVTDAAPEEVILSRECDVLLDEEDAAAALLRERLGPESAWSAEHGLYLDLVPPRLPLLVEGWSDRLVPIDANGVTGRCLEVHDLIASKLGAGRLKDYEFVAALHARRLFDLPTLRARIDTVGEPRLRAILLARLQIALEGAG